MRKVINNVEIAVAAIVGMGMWFMGGRCVNDVIPRSRRVGDAFQYLSKSLFEYSSGNLRIALVDPFDVECIT
jgi:hypothetical protein